MMKKKVFKKITRNKRNEFYLTTQIERLDKILRSW